MRTIPVKKEDIKTYLKEFRYYIIYYFDRLDFGEGYIIDGLDIDNINEAFLFDEDKCMHIYREDGVKGVLYVYESGDQIIEEEQIAKKGKEFKSLKSLVVKKIINTGCAPENTEANKDDDKNYDEDGQAYIERVLPAKLVFE